MDNKNVFNQNVSDVPIKSAKNYVSLPTLIISLITTVVFVIIIFSNWQNIMDFVWVESSENIQVDWEILSIWDEVMWSGELDDDGDIVNYTHSLDLDAYWEVYLKSSTINLTNYEWKVYFEWIVDRIYQWVPIVSVDTIYSLEDDFSLSWLDLSWNDEKSMYLPKLWIYLDSNFFENYDLVNNWEYWEIKIKHLDTNKIIVVSYFKCENGNNERDCERFNDIFSQTSSQNFVNSYWITYYKQSEVQSWFFSNWNLFGYFIDDVEDSIVKDLTKYIKLVGVWFFDKYVKPNLSFLCNSWSYSLDTLKNRNISINNDQIVAVVDWSDSDGNEISCKVQINPELQYMSKILSFDIDLNIDDSAEEENDEGVDEKEDDSNITSYDRDTDVQQFPVNLEKSLEFTSRRWHTIVFPSSNIAYAGQTVQEDFDQVWVSCFSAMNVVQYSEKDLVGEKWNVKVYECNVKDSFDESNKKLIYKNIWDRSFVVEIVDPAWVDFANNIEIRVD